MRTLILLRHAHAEPVSEGQSDLDRALSAAGMPQRRFGLLRTHVIQTPEFRFARPLVGFESFAEGELIATDGAEEIRAPCDDCTVLMPARAVVVGREGLYLTRPVD